MRSWGSGHGFQTRQVVDTLRRIPWTLQLAVGVLIIGGFTVATALAPVIAPYSPVRADPSAALQPPSGSHWLGTDELGFDVLSRLLYAPRIDLLIPVIAASLSFAIGVPIGAWVGYFTDRPGWRGAVSEHLMRVVDVLQAFPVFVLALALVATLGRGLDNVVYALVVLNTPVLIRLMRTSVHSVRERPFIDAAICVGNSETRLIFRHLLPNAIGPALVNASVLTGTGILITAGLSFVGAGVPVPTPEWGYMVSTGARSISTGHWWPAVFPGVCIGLAVLGFALLGDAIELQFNPDRRSQ